MRSRLTVFALLLFVLLPAAAAHAAANTGTVPASRTAPLEEPGIGLRLLDVPAATQDDPRARSYIVDHLNPGTTIERRIQIANGTDETRDFRLYPSAATVQDNAFSPATGQVHSELTTWTSVDRPALALEPGTSTEVLVTVDVPPDAPEGEQYAVVWAEVRSSNDAAKGIVNASRVGVRVYLSVGPGNGPPADFSIDRLTPSRNPDGAPELATTVTNTGGRALDITGSLQLDGGPAGLSAGPNPIDKGTTIAPGDSAPVRVTLPSELPNGPWQATLELKSGLVSHEATATIVFPDAGQGVAVDADEGANPIFVAAVAVGIVLVLAGLALWWLRRRKTVRAWARIPPGPNG
ncbi:hypothetical protein [Arthrobacter sp. KK5.5]|uniref:hypothetical protein n=1 Tax=Arthrobacter sp. KK5.5 TaxID=3373084 RepID=UPI003EE5AD14